MIDIALLEPEIPPNTGNIARLCAATGAGLHLIGRLGFHLNDRALRRAGLDYWNDVQINLHATLGEFEAERQGRRIWCFSSHAQIPYTQVHYQQGDCLLFGGESHGLPETVVRRYGERALLIPMHTTRVRSLNLATAVGIALYEGLRQLSPWGTTP